MNIELVCEPCDCPPGRCAHFLDNDAECVNRLDGDVRTLQCPNHSGWSWHRNGECLKCAALSKGEAEHG